MKLIFFGFLFASAIVATSAECGTLPLEQYGQRTCHTERCSAGPGDLYIVGNDYSAHAEGYFPEGVTSYQVGIYAGPEAGDSMACYDTGGSKFCTDGVHTANAKEGVYAGFASVGPVYGGRVVWGNSQDLQRRGENGFGAIIVSDIPRATIKPGEQWCAVIRTNDGEEYSLNLDRDGKVPGSLRYVGCGNLRPIPPTPISNSCKVTTNSPINIEFGNVERSEISASEGTEISTSLGISCTGTSSHTFNVKLNMSPTSWSTKQIRTSNTSLGVSLSANGTQLANNSSFKMNVNGSSSQELDFYLLRSPLVDPVQIATGSFKASATLIVTED